ncbi:hypothetical protein G6011_10918 [Alternaria panax]|uniref:Uncharacterized protein n=1 Tax=Alternaria panax TaxID=48097 RepID=A0AAD4ICU1_9PLEO|nr:hypothetical protein G6011_10918 [Alternaria panax]
MNTSIMLGNSKWAPGGENDKAEANAPPTNAPTGPRDVQRGLFGAAVNLDTEARVERLEDKQKRIYDHVDVLQQMHLSLSGSVRNLKYSMHNPVSPVVPATPLACSTSSDPANNRLFHVPVQGDQTDTDFLLLPKKLASWPTDNYRGMRQRQRGKIPANVKDDYFTDMHLMEVANITETQTATARSMEWKGKGEEEREDAKEKNLQLSRFSGRGGIAGKSSRFCYKLCE